MPLRGEPVEVKINQQNTRQMTSAADHATCRLAEAEIPTIKVVD